VADRSSRAAELIAPHAATTMSAVYVSTAPPPFPPASRLTSTVATSRPDALVTRRLTVSVREQRDVRIGERRRDAADVRVGLGLHQTGEAVAGLASDAPALPAVLLVEHDPQRRVEWAVAQPREILVKLLDARLVADGRVRVGGRCGRLRGILAAGSMHMIECLRLRVVGLQVLVPEGPCRRDASVVLDLSEVLPAQAEKRRAVELRMRPRSSCMRVERFSAPVVPHLLGVVVTLDIDRARIPVALFAGHKVSALEHQDPLPGRRERMHQRPTARAGSDDDDVVAPRGSMYVSSLGSRPCPTRCARGSGFRYPDRRRVSLHGRCRHWPAPRFTVTACEDAASIVWWWSLAQSTRCAPRTRAYSSAQQHADQRCGEIDPEHRQRVRRHRGAEAACGIHAHSRQRRLDSDEERDQRAGTESSETRPSRRVGDHQHREHESEGDQRFGEKGDGASLRAGNGCDVIHGG